MLLGVVLVTFERSSFLTKSFSSPNPLGITVCVLRYIGPLALGKSSSPDFSGEESETTLSSLFQASVFSSHMYSTIFLIVNLLKRR
jgi:hypothetical protein